MVQLLLPILLLSIFLYAIKAISTPLFAVIFIFTAVLYIFKPKLELYTEIKDDKLTELKERVSQCFPEIARVKMSASDKSFTVNKAHIFLCMKDKKGEYYDDNTLTNVLLHEYAHVLCDEIDDNEHKAKYRSIFRALLERATNCGIYDPTKPMPENYCEY